jgi:hypothetical protein
MHWRQTANRKFDFELCNESVEISEKLIAEAGDSSGTHKTKKLNSVAFSPQATYTDRASAACRRSYSQLLRIEGVAWSVQWIPKAFYFGFLDRSRYFSIQVAPQLPSRGWVDPVPEPLLLRKSVNAGNRTRDLRICSLELWPLDHRGGSAINSFWTTRS